MTQQINLLDPSLLPARDWCDGRFVLGLALLLSLGSTAHLAYETHALERFLAHAGSDAQDNATADASMTDAALAELQARVAANENLLQAVGTFAELPRGNAARLRDLIKAMPETLWLQEVEFSVERGVRIAGNALDAGALARFADRLGTQPAFQGLPLHLFALQPDVADATAGASDTVPASTPPAHYGFLLSSIASGRDVGGQR